MFRTHCWTNPWFAAFGCAAGLQVLAVAAAASLGYLLSGPSAAIGASFGSAIALVNIILLALRLAQGERTGDQNAHRELRSFFRSSLERFAVVTLLLATGLGLLHLAPLPLLAGFVFGQASLMIFQFLRAF
jgi:hypothetical protein